jgi:formylglycine-generating enzyme required for sulfatase activity
MKTLKSLLWLGTLSVFVVADPASAQTTPSLGLQFTAVQPSLSLTGTVGVVYSIQYASDLSSTSRWTDRTLLQAKEGSSVWNDPSAPAPSQRFYRAVSVPAPADTNLVFMQPGTFTMGSPTDEAERGSDELQHTVTISRGFWMGKYLVTQEGFRSVVGWNPSQIRGDPTLPVEALFWTDATNYCALRTAQERTAGLIPTNYVYRLPTESEWEYADRAGATTRFSYGDDPGYTSLTNYAWYSANSVGTTHPVGQLLPNPWGLYDMHGNVMEWCQDRYGTYPAGSVTDPQGAVSGTYHVVRGGSYYFDGRYCRSATRDANSPAIWVLDVGLRVVLAPVPQ